MIESYLNERDLMIESETLRMTQGGPQGSLRGPTIWNIFYDSVLELQLPIGCMNVAYVDDMVLLAKSSDQ